MQRRAPMNPFSEIRIETLAFGGAGIGRHPTGKVVLVPGAAPNELVRVEIIREKRNHDVAVVREIIEPSPVRIDPPCSSASRCGGCTWMHIDLDAQRSWKSRLLETELSRAGLLTHSGILGELIGGASRRHRVRARLHLAGGIFGTKAAKSNDVVKIVECPILTEELEAFALEMSSALDDARIGDAEVELYVDARGDRGLSARIATPRDAPTWEQIARKLGVQSVHLVAALGRTLRTPRQPLVEDSAGRPLEYEPGVFVQTHRELNTKLVGLALDGAGTGKSFVEAYAGAGNFTVHLAQKFESGFAAEGHRRAVKLLRRNLAGLDSAVEVRAENDGQTSRRLSSRPPVDLLLADPPRLGKGLYKSFRGLFEAAPPRKVVLVSCHPMAAIRDLVRLRDDAGYELQRVVPIDMFPQTHHLELVAVLAST